MANAAKEKPGSYIRTPANFRFIVSDSVSELDSSVIG